MNPGRLFVVAALAASMCLLAACGGGGGEAIVVTPDTPPVAAPTGRDKFLLFPNPQEAPADPAGPPGTQPPPPINSEKYAQAYYAAIDRGNQKDTLAKWKAANGFGTNTGTEVVAVFGDTRDLGYGRRMTGRISADGKTIAFMVENYQVDPGGAYGYNPLSLEAAVREDTRWRILINAIEWSPGPDGGESFAKFFNFDARTGARSLTIDLDGRGTKFMPGPCLTCHGGRGDALVPDASNELKFPLVRNSASNTPGDVQARLAPLEVSHFDFSPIQGFTKPDLEQKLKTMNMMVLCSYPWPDAAQVHGVPKSFCNRRPAIASEWQGTAADLLIDAYGGEDGLPQRAYAEPKVPDDWRDGKQSDLYTNVVAPSCRACHILRGVLNAPDVDLTTLARFQSYAKARDGQEPLTQRPDDRTKVHVFDRIDMPLAKLVFDTFWSSTNPAILANFLTSREFVLGDATGAPPRRPIAIPGPARRIQAGDTPLSGTQSLDASTFQWSIFSGPAGATLSNDRAAKPVFKATQPGTYVVRLIVSNGTVQSAPAFQTLEVFGLASVATFGRVRQILFDSCAGCHVAGGSGSPPVFFADRAANGAAVPRTDIPAFYAEVRSRINFSDIVASPLLRKPADLHHSGGLVNGFDTSKDLKDPDREDYQTFLEWILAGAPKN